MSKPFSIIIIELGDDATRRLKFWRQTLLRLASNTLPGIAGADHFGKELRGAAAVATMAEIERLLREALVELSIDINHAGVPISDLSPGLRALASDAYFQAMSMSSKGDKHWDNRAIVTRLETNMQIAKFPARTSSTPQPPLDGKTIRASHFQRIWTVLDLDESAIPEANMEIALTAMSTMRNDVAHGNDPISEIFHEQASGKSAASIAEHILQLTRLVDHFCLSLSSYASERKYRIT
ncbi:MAE_28990/MAE_18760 family HEPN-like nuclease [Arthrobacter sp. N199823]|uniref:MAE_28990/MAE_18760 family HEPN-like nuclease n=1 Tax=Arthrobacter sp. N199823 TaxID=2058895 RepID=UPI000CE56CB9|nr:MAE_28990/MAE_18760 family HEPN-like nuclease [Arthrobacter sp. N199823]